jgi:hypothetical protein
MHFVAIALIGGVTIEECLDIVAAVQKYIRQLIRDVPENHSIGNHLRTMFHKEGKDYLLKKGRRRRGYAIKVENTFASVGFAEDGMHDLVDCPALIDF